MKGLSIFEKFDFEAFSTGKEYSVTGCIEWSDYNTKAYLGTKVEVIITKDETDYHTKNGTVISNLFEKLTFKVSKAVSVSAGDKIMPVNAKATAYGRDKNGFTNFKNMLSVQCDDIIVL